MIKGTVGKVGQIQEERQNLSLGVFIPAGIRQSKAYKRLRLWWWRILYRWSKTRVQAGKITCTFWTPAPGYQKALPRFYGEEIIFKKFLGVLRVGDVIWDVGAEIGFYSVFAAQIVGTSGEICVFEPRKKAMKHLQKNCRLNHVDNIRQFRLALGDQPGYGQLTGIHVSQDVAGDVEIRSGDDLTAKGEAPIPNILKIDVEGSEWHVLNGMRTALSETRCQFIFIEIHPASLGEKRPQDVEDILSECGFSIISRYPRGEQQHWFASKTSACTNEGANPDNKKCSDE